MINLRPYRNLRRQRKFRKKRVKTNENLMAMQDETCISTAEIDVTTLFPRLLGGPLGE